MLLKSKKVEMIKDLEETIKKSESLVFVNFHGLKVGDETMLRRDLRNQGVGYKVSRKTLLARAFKGKRKGRFQNSKEKLLLHILQIPFRLLEKFTIFRKPIREY